MSFSSAFANTANAMTNIKNSASNREIAQEKAYMLKQNWEQQQSQRDVAQNDYEVIKANQEKQDKKNKRLLGGITNTKALEIVTDMSVQNINSFNHNLATSDGSIQQSMGKPANYSIRQVSPGFKDDMDALKRTAGQMGVDWSMLEPEDAQEVLDGLVASNFFVMGNDGEIVDANDFLKTSGGYSQATNNQMEVVNKQQTAMTDTINKAYENSEFKQKERQANKDIRDKIAIEETAQYQAALKRQGMVKDGTATKTPSPDDIIIQKFQSSKKTPEDLATMISEIQQLKDKSSDVVGGSSGGNPLTEIRNLEEKIEAAKFQKADPEEIQKMQDELDFKSDTYNEDLYGKAAAGNAKAKRELKERVTAAQYEDMQTFASVKDDTGLIKKYNAARDAYDTAETWMRTENKVFDAFEDSNLDWNAFENAKSELGGYWRDLTNSKATTKEKQNAYARIKTLLGASMADYIKDISGSAVADSERRFLNDLVFGGAWKDREELATRISTFRETRVDKARQLYKTYGSQVKPNQSNERLATLDSWSKGRKLKDTVEEKPKSSKTLATYEQAKKKYPNLTQENYNKWYASRGGK